MADEKSKTPDTQLTSFAYGVMESLIEQAVRAWVRASYEDNTGTTPFEMVREVNVPMGWTLFVRLQIQDEPFEDE